MGEAPDESPRQSPSRFQRMAVWPIPFNIDSANSSNSNELDSTDYIDVSETDTEEPFSLTCDEINCLADRLVELQDRAQQRLQWLNRHNPDLTSEDVFDQGFGNEGGS